MSSASAPRSVSCSPTLPRLAEVVEEVARLGARLLLQTALEAGVRRSWAATATTRPRRQPRHRNGHRPIIIKTTSGPLTLEPSIS
jgi:hypothetical protein